MLGSYPFPKTYGRIMTYCKTRVSVFKEIEHAGSPVFIYFREANKDELRKGSDHIVPSAMLTEFEHKVFLKYGE